MKKHQANFSFRLTWTDLKEISLSLNVKKRINFVIFFFSFFLNQLDRLIGCVTRFDGETKGNHVCKKASSI